MISLALGVHSGLEAAVQNDPGTASEGYPLKASQQIRVTPIDGSQRVTGQVLRVTSDSLVVVIPGSPLRSPSEVGFTWNEIRDVERSGGREDHRRWAAGWAMGASAWVLWTPIELALYAPIFPGGIALGLATLYRPHQWEALPRKPVVGERIRIDRVKVGSLVAMEDQALVLDPAGEANRPRTIPRENIAYLERSLGTRRHALQGMLYGTALGLGALFADRPYNWLGPPTGALLGLGIGSLIQGERWAEAIVP